MMEVSEQMDTYGLKASDFGKDFIWGVASSAYQIEGACDEDGKGKSIWDTFVHKKRFLIPTVITHETGDVACDFYHRYESDIATIADLGFKANRFSLSWPRILPEGTGKVNQKGLDFYSRVVDANLKNNLEPWITFYHWDLPQKLQDKGGWFNRQIVEWFGEYVDVVTKKLGDRVKNWMIFNEPLSFCAGGYLVGAMAPGIINPFSFMASVHHVNLCQAKGAEVVRANVSKSNVGTTHVIAPVHAMGKSGFHLKAKESVHALMHRIYIDPNLGLGYPFGLSPIIDQVKRFIKDEDEQNIKVDFDFIGAQYYSTTVAIPVPLLNGVPTKPKRFNGQDADMLKSPVNPKGIYESVQMLHEYNRFKNITITESGFSCYDTVENKRVIDLRRVDYVRRHLPEVLRAKKDGIPINGYMYWSFMDNFEWALGFRPRYGLIYVNFETLERTVKDSGWWFKKFLSQ